MMLSLPSLSLRFIDGLAYTEKAVIHQDELVNGFAMRTNKTHTITPQRQAQIHPLPYGS